MADNVKIGIQIEGLTDAVAAMEALRKGADALHGISGASARVYSQDASLAGANAGTGLQNYDMKSREASSHKAGDMGDMTSLGALIQGHPVGPSHYALSASDPAGAINNDNMAGHTRVQGEISPRVAAAETRFNSGVVQVSIVQSIALPIAGFNGNGGPGGGGGGGGMPGGHPDPNQPVDPINHPDRNKPGKPLTPEEEYVKAEKARIAAEKAIKQQNAYSQADVIDDLTKDIHNKPLRTMTEDFLTSTRGGQFMLQKLGVAHDAFPAIFDGATKLAGKAVIPLAVLGAAADIGEKALDYHNVATARRFEVDKEQLGFAARGQSDDPFEQAAQVEKADRDTKVDLLKKGLGELPMFGGLINAGLEATYYRDVEKADVVSDSKAARKKASQALSFMTGGDMSDFAKMGDMTIDASTVAGSLGPLAVNQQSYLKSIKFREMAENGVTAQQYAQGTGTLASIMSSPGFAKEQLAMFNGKAPTEYTKEAMRVAVASGDVQAVVNLQALEKSSPERLELAHERDHALNQLGTKAQHQITIDDLAGGPHAQNGFMATARAFLAISGVEQAEPDYGAAKKLLSGDVKGWAKGNGTSNLVTHEETDPAWLAKYKAIGDEYTEKLKSIPTDFAKQMVDVIANKGLLQSIAIGQTETIEKQTDLSRMQRTGASLASISAFQSGDMNVPLRATLTKDELLYKHYKETKGMELQAAQTHLAIEADKAQIAGNEYQARETYYQMRDIQIETGGEGADLSMKQGIAGPGRSDAGVENAFRKKRGNSKEQYDNLMKKSRDTVHYDIDKRRKFIKDADLIQFDMNVTQVKEKDDFFDNQAENQLGIESAKANQAYSKAMIRGDADEVLAANKGRLAVDQNAIDLTGKELKHAQEVGSQADVDRLSKQQVDQITALNKAAADTTHQFGQMKVAVAQATVGISAMAVSAAQNLYGKGGQELGKLKNLNSVDQGNLADAAEVALNKDVADGILSIKSSDYTRRKTQITSDRNNQLGTIIGEANSPLSAKQETDRIKLQTSLEITGGTYAPQGNVRAMQGQSMNYAAEEKQEANKNADMALADLDRLKHERSTTDHAMSDSEYQGAKDTIERDRARNVGAATSKGLSAYRALEQGTNNDFLAQVINSPGRFGIVASQFSKLEAAKYMQAFGSQYGETTTKDRDAFMFAGPRLASGDLNALNTPSGFFSTAMAKLSGGGSLIGGGIGATPGMGAGAFASGPDTNWMDLYSHSPGHPAAAGGALSAVPGGVPNAMPPGHMSMAGRATYERVMPGPGELGGMRSLTGGSLAGGTLGQMLAHLPNGTLSKANLPLLRVEVRVTNDTVSAGGQNIGRGQTQTTTHIVNNTSTVKDHPANSGGSQQ